MMAEWNIINSSFLIDEWRFDSEYWRSKYLNNLEIIRATGKGGLITCQLRKVVKDVIGSAFYPSFVGYYSSKGIPFIRVADLGDLFLNRETMVRIDPSIINEHRQVSKIQPGDIVIAKGGTIGSACILTEDFGESAVCRDVIAVVPDPDKVDPFYLTIYLNTRYGNLQLDRNKSQQVQSHLTFPAVKRIEVAYPDIQRQQKIRDIAIASYAAQENSQKFYQKAQQLLETELGLDRLNLQKPVGYSARFSTVGLAQTYSAGRIDAQCYSPIALYYEKWLMSQGNSMPLSLLLEGVVKGRQQIDTEAGTVDYCSIKHISSHEIANVSKCFPTSDTPLAITNDLLLAVTGATIGKVGVVRRYKQLAYSGDLLRLRVNSGINPYYLLLALEHPVGQIQFNRWITGSTNGHLAPDDVGRVLVPRLQEEAEAKISELVSASINNKLESESLLNQAKTRVEQMIEEAVQHETFA